MAAARGVTTGDGSIPDSRAAPREANAVATARAGAPKDAAVTDVIAPGASRSRITIVSAIAMSASAPRSQR
jgi:hypothetical protein